MVGSIHEAGRTLNYPLPMSGLGGVGRGGFGFGFGGVGLGLEAPNTLWEYLGRATVALAAASRSR